MKLRFYIYLNDDDSVKTRVYPNYKDDLSKDTDQENNQKFYREKISGKLSFLNKPTKDFDFIVSQMFDTQYNLIIEKSDDFGQTWSREFLGKFFQTDCTINYDDQKLEVQPDAVDEYTAVMSGIDKEYNLSEKAIAIQSINLQKRPLIQVFIPGDEVVSCFLSGMTWEQEVTGDLSGDNLTVKYHFALSSVIRTLYVNVEGVPKDATGVYTAVTSGSSSYQGTMNGPNGYKAVIYAVEIPANQTWETFIEIRKVSNDELFLIGSVYAEQGIINADNIIMYDGGLSAPQGTAKFKTTAIYARYLLDKPSINGVSTYPISSEDIVDDNRNYRYVIGYGLDVVTMSQNLSDEPTQYGKNPDGKYFLPPYSLFGQKFYPLARSQWEYVSVWFALHIFDSILEVQARSAAVLKDSYPLSSVISVLLKEFSPNITHEDTAEYSQFLYGDINPIIQRKFRLFISQKTNVLNIQYQNPAQKTPMTLQNIMNMLRDCFRCYWYIEDNKLKIEHVKFFKNGGSYDVDPEISYDVTKMINVRNGKDWAFSTSEITFDKIDMPERFQFKWMDDVSDAFEGSPIEVLSRYVMPGKIEEINVSNFISDIDYLLLNPSDIGSDGFALMAAVESDALTPVIYGGYYFSANNGASESYDIKPEYVGKSTEVRLYALGSGVTNVRFYNSVGSVLSPVYPFTPDGDKVIEVVIPIDAVQIGIYSFGFVEGYFKELNVTGEYELPFINISVNSVSSLLQNGLTAFTTIQPNFYIYDLPAKRVEINGIETISETDRKKKQSLEFPVDGYFDPMELVKTHIGLGQVDKISLNLHSRMTKTTLKYDTEQ